MKFIPCLGYESGNPIDGFDYDCEYENSGGFGCDDCICNGGAYSPISGKSIKETTRQKYAKKYGLAEYDPKYLEEENKNG